MEWRPAFSNSIEEHCGTYSSYFNSSYIITSNSQQPGELHYLEYYLHHWSNGIHIYIATGTSSLVLAVGLCQWDYQNWIWKYRIQLQLKWSRADRIFYIIRRFVSLTSVDVDRIYDNADILSNWVSIYLALDWIGILFPSYLFM